MMNVLSRGILKERSKIVWAKPRLSSLWLRNEMLLHYSPGSSQSEKTSFIKIDLAYTRGEDPLRCHDTLLVIMRK